MSAVLPDTGLDQPQQPSMRRRSRADGRSRRWDTGPAATARDLAVLRFVGEQYAVRVDVAAVLLARLAPDPVPGQGGWVCERELWRRRGKASWHLADGAVTAPVPASWQGVSEAWELVEVELTHKARPRVVAALKTRPPHTALVTYYVPAALHAPLSAQLASVVRELGGRPAVTVEPLPQVPGVTYMPARGDAR
jgi:hypothetical protein